MGQVEDDAEACVGGLEGERHRASAEAPRAARGGCAADGGCADGIDAPLPDDAGLDARSCGNAAALEELAECGLRLVRVDGALELTDGTMSVRGDFGKMLPRISPGNLGRELIVRAAKVKGEHGPLIAVDATAGLGEDALLLAAAGFEVRLYERNRVIAALLRDALARASSMPELAWAAQRMKLFEADSAHALREIDVVPDIVLLDPMFPEKQKSSRVKKKAQLLQRLERPCDDESTLLDAAMTARPRKVIVKRPAKGPHLAGRKPDYELSGKAVRFDCYVIAR